MMKRHGEYIEVPMGVEDNDGDGDGNDDEVFAEIDHRSNLSEIETSHLENLEPDTLSESEKGIYSEFGYVKAISSHFIKTADIDNSIVFYKYIDLLVDEKIKQKTGQTRLEYETAQSNRSQTYADDKAFKASFLNEINSPTPFSNDCFQQIRRFVNVEVDQNGYTALQKCCTKNSRWLRLVEQLLDCGADPNKITSKQLDAPFVLAAKNKNFKILKKLLSHEEIQVSPEQFSQLVGMISTDKSLGKELIKTIALTKKEINPDDFIYHAGEDRTRTILHYAIIFSLPKEIGCFLKWNASLLKSLDKSKRPLDYITLKDLAAHFDSCLSLDNYKDICDLNYKMCFKFGYLLENGDEMELISSINDKEKLQPLLGHPFIYSYLHLKWTKAQCQFWFWVVFQFILYVSFSFTFFNLQSEDHSFLMTACTILLTLTNAVIKLPILFYIDPADDFWESRTMLGRNIKLPYFHSLQQLPIHFSVELFLVLMTILLLLSELFSCLTCRLQLIAYIFVLMPFSFLLTVGYHPKLIKWSTMLKAVVKTAFNFLLIIALIIIGYGIAFCILFQTDDKDDFFQSVGKAIFRTAFMALGEYDVGDLKYGYGGYVLLLVFGFTCLILMNFLTAVAVSDIERLEKESEINTYRSLVAFLKFTHCVYKNKYIRAVLNSCNMFDKLNPLLFDKNNDNNFRVDFYINKNEIKAQGKTRNVPNRLSRCCINKIQEKYFEDHV